MFSKIVGLIALIILVASFPRATFGQSIGGTFSGIVKDQAGPLLQGRNTNYKFGDRPSTHRVHGWPREL